MHMTFWFDYKIDELLFPNVTTSSVGGLLLVIVIVLLLAAIYEDMKVFLAWIKFNAAAGRSPHKMRCMNEGSMPAPKATSKSQRALWFLLEQSIYVLEVLLGYIVMLLVMTYNGYLFIAVLIGSGLSYFLFGPTMMKIRLQTSKLKLPCDKCPRAEESTTSSTEAITFSESSTNFVSDPPCCSRKVNADTHGDC